ncbi:MAG: SIS domain-containing protein [bacterium]|nr:SIS domain-containing protein [bacterium]
MINRHIEESIALQKTLLSDGSFSDAFGKATQALYECLHKGGKLLIGGNGGSAAQAQHFAAEFVGRYDKLERRAHSALALNVDTSILTAWSNDYHFDLVFARQVEAHGRKGDVFIGLSTSGNSKNIIEALRVAKAAGLTTVTFLGKDGGHAKGLADVELIVPSKSTPHIQEIHTILIHALTAAVEARLHNAAGANDPKVQLA